MTIRGTAAALMTFIALIVGLAAPAQAAAPPADLSINLSGPSQVMAGGTGEFRMHVGLAEPPADLTTIRAVLTLPAGVAFESATPGEGGPCTAAGSTVTCAAEKKDETLDAFVWHVTVRFAADIALGDQRRLTAVASSADTEATPANNTQSVDTEVVHRADLGVTAIPPTGKITLGQPVKYTLVVRNHGPGVVQHFALQESFDSHWYRGGDVLGTDAQECFADPGMMICDLARELRPDEEIRLEHVLPTSAEDTVTDLQQAVRVSLFQYAGDTNPANDEVEVPLEFTAKPGTASPSPSATTGPGDDPTLPITGPGALPIGLAGLLLLLLGTGAVLATRRRGRA
ncbi:hypothetical protein AB0M02_07135 [Actinoplanes sp. NPDC051861]|uniref:hypothetical protein n=1 Tax=Actinoplanes sp. NPDC051861 TaxID=3155170 RepID=UPI00344A03A7